MSASLTLQWKDNSDNESGFWVQRSPNGEAEWRYIAVVRADTQTYVDSNLELGEQQFYRLSAFDSQVSTAWSNVAGGIAGSGRTFVPSATPTSTLPPTLTPTPEATLEPPTVTPPSPSPVPTDTPTPRPSSTPSPSKTPVPPSATASPTAAASETPEPTKPPPTNVDVDALVFEEESLAGRLTGTYVYTWEDDGLAQVIRERSSSGKKHERYSYLEHVWRIELPERSSLVLHARAWSQASSDDEHFVLDISFDGETYVELLELTAREEGSGLQSIPLPAGSSGTLHVRVRDSDQTPGRRVLDKLYVDHLFVRGSNAPDSTDPDPRGARGRIVAQAF